MEDNKSSSRKEVEESRGAKILVLPGLLLTTIVSALVFAGLQNSWTIHDTLYQKIDKYRATTQIVVHVLTSIFGGIHIQTICGLINFYVRISLTRKPMRLDRLKFWTAITSVKPDWFTRKKSQTFVFAFYLWTLLPPALWTGALTPVSTTRSYSLPAAISIPQYTANSHQYWSQNIYHPPFSLEVNPKGTFSYIPIQHRLGFLITDGSAATSTDDQPVQLSKNDNSHYKYIGRSYGIGSSVGLTDDGPIKKY
jgi:hypothetical protein